MGSKTNKYLTRVDSLKCAPEDNILQRSINNYTMYNVYANPEDSFLKGSIGAYDVREAFTTQGYGNLIRFVRETPDDDPTPFIIAKTVITTGLAIISAALPVVGQIAMSVIGGVAGYYFDSQGADKISDVWNKMKSYVENFMYAKIENDKFNEMIAKLDGIASNIKQYTSYLRSGQKNLAYQFCITAISNTRAILSQFVQAGYEVLLLPLYTQACLLYLLLCRDLIIFGTDWGISEQDLNTTKRNFRRDVYEFQQYIKDTYEKGYAQRVSNAEANNIHYGDYGYELPNIFNNAEIYKSTAQWNYVNAYVRGMTLSTLNIAAVFPTIDPDVYVTQIRIKNSKEIFSPIFGCVPQGTSINDINKVIDNPQKYTGELIKTEHYLTKQGIYGITGTKQTSIMENTMVSHPVEGDTPNISNYSTTSLYATDAFPITSALVRYSGSVGNLKYFYNQENLEMPTKTINEKKYYDLEKFEGKNISVGLPNNPKIEPLTLSIIPESDGKLSSVRSLMFKKEGVVEYSNYGTNTFINMSMGTVLGYRERECTYKHNLDLYRVTQIPAEMYSYGYNLSSQKELLNGQNAIVTSKSLNSQVEYEIFSPVNNGQYELALRYSSKNTASASISLNGVKQGQITFGPTNNNNDYQFYPGTYGEYGRVIYNNALPLKKGSNKILLEINGEVSLDKLEFLAFEVIEEIGDKNGRLLFKLENQNIGEEVLKVTTKNGNQTIGGSGRWDLYVDGEYKYSFQGNTPVDTIAKAINDAQYKGEHFWITEYEDYVYSTIKNVAGNATISFHQVEDHNFAETSFPNAIFGNDPNLKFYIYVGGKLVFRGSHAMRMGDIVSIFNKLNIKGAGVRFKTTAVATNREQQDDMITSLFLRNHTKNYEMDYSKLNPQVSNYDILACTVAKSYYGAFFDQSDSKLLNRAKYLLKNNV